MMWTICIALNLLLIRFKLLFFFSLVFLFCPINSVYYLNRGLKLLWLGSGQWLSDFIYSFFSSGLLPSVYFFHHLWPRQIQKSNIIKTGPAHLSHDIRGVKLHLILIIKYENHYIYLLLYMKKFINTIHLYIMYLHTFIQHHSLPKK